MIREEIKNLVQKAIKNLYKKEVEVVLERPTAAVFGDYSTNIAMTLKKNPQEIANFIKSDFLEKIEVKNGFINFFVSKQYLQNQVGEILKKKERFGDLKIGKGKKVNVEFCSANPTGPLHLGHGRGAFWGDVLSNVFERAGYKTTREYFINNYGKQISLLGQSIDTRYREILGQKVELGEGFYLGDYVREIAREIVKKDGDKYLRLPEKERIDILKQKGLEKMLALAKELLLRVGVKYDIWFSERVLYEKKLVKKAIEALEKKGFTYKSENALWFASTKHGDDKDRVLIKASGETTYLASDIAYHLNKVSRKYDLMIDGWGADHWGYVPRIMAAAKVFGFDKKLKIVVGQFVRLVEKGREVKMSKRSGSFITLEELIEEVGVDVARFFFLMKSIDTHIDFNLDLAKEQSDKNPVYYVQYAYARICSILRKSKPEDLNRGRTDLLKDRSEFSLIKKLIQFPEIVEDTARDYQIQKLPQYAMELAAVFHQFYHDCRVISEDKELTRARLGLVLAAKIVLKNTLGLMGISAPEKM